jgi:hypothetical protein
MVLPNREAPSWFPDRLVPYAVAEGWKERFTLGQDILFWNFCGIH